MTLEMLKYGSFKPTWVASDSKALPGYGGEVQGWADYKFAVQAIEKRESGMPDNEKKKLGPLSLRLVERLAGPALQVAKKIGLDRLSEAGGTKTLLDGLEAHLLPLQKQAALELYHAGMKEGILSRQHGESMSSYCLRRQSWWTQLQELDSGIQCSTSILGEQLLLHAGLGHLEQQMVRTGCQNDLSDLDKVSNILRDQFGNLHDRESRGKGGKGRFENKGRYDNKPWYQRNTGYYTARWSMRSPWTRPTTRVRSQPMTTRCTMAMRRTTTMMKNGWWKTTLERRRSKKRSSHGTPLNRWMLRRARQRTWRW